MPPSGALPHAISGTTTIDDTRWLVRVNTSRAGMPQICMYAEQSVMKRACWPRYADASSVLASVMRLATTSASESSCSDGSRWLEPPSPPPMVEPPLWRISNSSASGPSAPPVVISARRQCVRMLETACM
jgi:hypothetical protein